MKSLANEEIDRNELINRLNSIPHSFFIKNNIEFMYLGGSWASKTNNWWSDIDIFVSIPEFQNQESKQKLTILMDMVEDIAQLTSMKNIQVNIFEIIPLHVQFQVIKDGIPIYERNISNRLIFIENLLNMYYDHQIWFSRMIDESLGV